MQIRRAIAVALARLRPNAAAEGREARALLDRFGGDVSAATRWCNDRMARAEAAGDRAGAAAALRLRRRVGALWAARIGARAVRAPATPFSLRRRSAP